MKEKERFEVLLEHMDRKIDLVLEGHQSLDRKIDRGLEEARLDREDIKRQMSLYVGTLSEKIDLNREEIAKNREEIGKNREAIEQNRAEIGKNREAIEQNRAEITKNRGEIVSNRTRIEGIDSKFSSSRQDYRDHEKRIRVLEAVK